MYQKLINVVEARTALELAVKKSKAEWEDKNAVQIAQLADLKEKEVLLREETVLNMEKEDKASVEVEDKIIVRQSRYTKSVDDARAMMNAMNELTKEMEESGITFNIAELFVPEIIVADKKTVLDIADKYNKLTGEDLEGILIKETKFVTIKNK